MIAKLDWERIPQETTYELRGYAEKYNDEHIYHIILLGDAKVGKKTYLNNIIHSEFKHLPTEIEGLTLSLLITGKDLIMIWNVPTTLNIFKMIDNDIKMMHGVIGMFDLTNELSFKQLVDHVGYLIRAYGKMYPLMLVGNKADLPRSIKKEDVLVYAYELGNCSCHRVPYAEMSSLQNIGVDMIIDNLITMINCNLMEKCSDLPALVRTWCKVPQFYSFQDEPRQKLQILEN